MSACKRTANAREMELMVAAGMSPKRLLLAATSGNARRIGEADRLCAVKPGLPADLVAVALDPTTEIAAIGDVMLVVKAGGDRPARQVSDGTRPHSNFNRTGADLDPRLRLRHRTA